MEMINWIKSLFVDYGAVNVLIMLLIIILTNLIKKPIIEHAQNVVDFAKKHGYDIDKSVITSNIIYIPFGLGLVLYGIYALILANFNFSVVDWSGIVANATVYGAISQTIYNIAKDKIKASLSKKDYSEVKKVLAEEREQAELSEIENIQGEHDLLEKEKQEIQK